MAPDDLRPDDAPLDEAIERWMRERPAPRAPDGFTGAVIARVRQERWRAERYWDLGFNIALAAGVVLIAAGVLGLAYLSGLSVVGRDAVLLFGEALTTVAGQVAPALPTYVGAFALTATALGLWWWAENY
jgi:MFS superfamily sulfate permease-like transporter